MRNAVRIIDKSRWVEILGFSLGALLIYFTFNPFSGAARFSIIFYAVLSIMALIRAIDGKPLLPFLKSRRINLAIIILYLVIGTIQGAYFYANFRRLSYESFGDYTLFEYVLAVFNILICVHLAWYLTGLSIPVMCVISILYAAFGFLVPGPFFHTGLSLKEMLEYFSLLMIEGGVYGAPLQVVVTLVAIFTLLSSLGQASGLIDTFLKASWRVAVKGKRLVPQFSVLSSMALSTITGSAMANVAATGVFTIPLMKKYGIRPKVAGAVETIASTGGQIMPPVMGAVAFLMVQFLGVPYLEIMKGGLPLALILYAAIFTAVHLSAGSEVGLPVSDIPKVHSASRSVVKQVMDEERLPTPGSSEQRPETVYEAPLSASDWFHLFSFASAVTVLILTYTLLNFTVSYGAFFAVAWYAFFELIYVMVTGFRKQGLRLALLKWIKIIYQGFSSGAASLIIMAFMAAAVGLVMKVMYATGASQVLGTYMLQWSGGQLLPLIVLSAVLCIFLGMISVSIASYILVAIIVAPVMINFGIPPLVSHFYVFLVAITSPITPPIGGGIIVASALSGANVWQVGFQACKIGVIYFFLPFALLVHPEILYFNLDTLVVFPLLVFAGCAVSIAANLQTSRRLDHLLRIILFVAGAASGWITETFYLYLSLGVGILVTTLLVYRNKQSFAISGVPLKGEAEWQRLPA